MTESDISPLTTVDFVREVQTVDNFITLHGGPPETKA